MFSRAMAEDAAGASTGAVASDSAAQDAERHATANQALGWHVDGVLPRLHQDPTGTEGSYAVGGECVQWTGARKLADVYTRTRTPANSRHSARTAPNVADRRASCRVLLIRCEDGRREQSQKPGFAMLGSLKLIFPPAFNVVCLGAGCDIPDTDPAPHLAPESCAEACRATDRCDRWIFTPDTPKAALELRGRCQLKTAPEAEAVCADALMPYTVVGFADPEATLSSAAAASIDEAGSTSTVLTQGTTGTFQLSGAGAWSNLGGPWSTPGQEAMFEFTAILSGSHTITITNNNYCTSPGPYHFLPVDAAQPCGGRTANVHGGLCEPR